MKYYDLYRDLLAENMLAKIEKNHDKNHVMVNVKYDKNLPENPFNYRNETSVVSIPLSVKTSYVFDLSAYPAYIETVRNGRNEFTVLFDDFTYIDKYISSLSLLKKEITHEEKAWQECVNSPFNFDYISRFLYPSDYVLPVNPVVSHEWAFAPKEREAFEKLESLEITAENAVTVAIMATKSAVNLLQKSSKKGSREIYDSLMDQRAQAVKALHVMDGMQAVDGPLTNTVHHSREKKGNVYVPIEPWDEVLPTKAGSELSRKLDLLTDLSTDNNYLAIIGSAVEGVYDYLANNPDCMNLLECIVPARRKAQKWIDDHRNYTSRCYRVQVSSPDDFSDYDNAENALDSLYFYSMGKEADNVIESVNESMAIDDYINEICCYVKADKREFTRVILQQSILNPDLSVKGLADLLNTSVSRVSARRKNIQRIQEKYHIVPLYRSVYVFKK